MAKYYLPHVVENVPCEFVYDADGRLRRQIEHYQRQGVVRIVAGPRKCHLVIDVQRPYTKMPKPLEIEAL